MADVRFQHSPTLVSIVVPTRDRAAQLKETIDSVCQQTHIHWELLIVDDGSTDGSQEMVRARAAEDKRIRLVERCGSRTGAQICRNLGFELSSGEYVIFLDSDDLLAPTCLEGRLRAIDGRSDIDFAVSLGDIFEETPGDLQIYFNVRSDTDDIDRLLACDFPWQTTGPMWRRSSFLRIGAWDEDLPSWQDWELHLRALLRGLKPIWVDEIDYHVRVSFSPEKTSTRQLVDRGHLDAAIDTFGKVQRQLEAAGGMTPSRRQALAGMYFVIVERWLRQKLWSDAIRVWRTCCQAGLIDQDEFRYGCVAIFSLRFPVLRRIGYHVMLPKMKSWPGMNKQASTFQQVRVAQQAHTKPHSRRAITAASASAPMRQA